MTSHDVIGRLRQRFGERRVGHAGTLDPDATGVLVVAVGMATRLLRFIETTSKSYTGVISFGIETSTLDASGEITVVHDMDPPDLDAVRSVIADHLTGPIEQIPPMVSAIRVDGRRLHELAREGIEVDRPPRPVTIHRFDVMPTGDPTTIAFEVDCTSGTYIRSLAADLGHLLGGGAHLRTLRRTAVGPYSECDAAVIDECVLLPVVEAVRSLTPIAVSDDELGFIAQGRLRPVPADGPPPWALIDDRGDVVAVYEAFDGMAKPSVVLPPAADR